MTGPDTPSGVIDLDHLRRAVVAIALEPARLRQLNAGQPLLAKGLVDNFVMALDHAWRLLPDQEPFARIEEALEAVTAVATDDEWADPAFVEAEVWDPARNAARVAADSRGWPLNVDPFDDQPATWRHRRGKRRKPPKRTKG